MIFTNQWVRGDGLPVRRALTRSNHVPVERGNEEVSVEPQVFEVLRFLIGNRQRVISRDDLHFFPEPFRRP